MVGLPATMLCVMALVGGVTDNGYARVGVAALIALGLPLFIADRLLPDHNPSAARGLVSDVLTVSWMLVAFLVAGAAHGMTRTLLVNEGDRLVREGYDVESAGTVEEAWALLGQQRFNAVITDMRLPDGTGLDLLRRMDEESHHFGERLKSDEARNAFAAFFSRKKKA